MEQHLDKILNDVVLIPKNTSGLIANNQGLCISSQGNISTNSSGIMVAILEQASKLEPNLNPPIVELESGKKKCFIHKQGAVTGVIYKDDASINSGVNAR